MLSKEALNPIKERGFDSKAQMRYLLMMAREHPEKYGWVYKVLEEHGAPSEEGPKRTNWEPPYNISPKTPSYKYRKAALSLLKIASNKNLGIENSLEKIANTMSEKLAAEECVRQYMARKATPKRKEELSIFIQDLLSDQNFKALSELGKAHAKNFLNEQI